MAQRIVTTADIQALSGKEGRNSNVVIALGKKSNRMVRYTYVKPNDPNTTKQKAKRSAFSNMAKNLAAWWKDQKPTTSNADGTEAYKIVLKAFKADEDSDNIYCTLRKKFVSKEGVLKVGDTTLDLTTGTTTSGGTTTNPTDNPNREDY